jgi:Replication initiator protein A
MEESNQASGMTESPTLTPTPRVGERSLVPNQQPHIPTAFTKVDNNLTGIGFFSASSKRSRKAVEKTTVIIDQGVEHRISILPSAKYGLPITQDQDFWLALMKLVADRLQTERKITNPFTFTTAELQHILGQSDAGKNYRAFQEWADVMSFTGIKGGAYDTVRKRWLIDRVSTVDRFVTVGKELEDGTIAEKNHIWFSQWQLDNINAGNLMPIELTIYTQLQNNIAKNLVPHLQEWLFASQRDGRFEKQYEDICQLLSVRVYRYRSQIQEQFQPSLDELTTHGYISKWAIEPMASRKIFKLVLWHGSKYHSDQNTRLESKRRHKGITAPASDAGKQPTPEQAPSRPRTPRQKTLQLQPEVNAEHLAALTSRGASEPQARKVLADLPTEYRLLETLEWADQQIATQPGKFNNPPGFYISLLRDRIQAPPTFQSSASRKAQEEAILAQQLAEAAKRSAEIEAEQEADAALDRLKASDPASFQALHSEANAVYRRELPFMADRLPKDSPAHEDYIRIRMKKALAAGWQPPAPAQPEPSRGAPGTVNQTINKASRQADRLQESAPALEAAADFAATLRAMLTTPQLSPASQPAPVATQPELPPFPVDEWI